MFCMGADGEMFNREGTPWPEANLTIVDLATYSREGYITQLSIAYISLLNTVNNIAERDQFKGRPIVKLTDEGHIITKNPLLSPYAVKITKMWRKLGAWFWLATQNVDDLPLPVWWAFMHALSKDLTSGAVAAIPCGTDLRQMRMDVDNARISNPLLAQEVTDFTHDCYWPCSCDNLT
ncbi:AAA-like domain-containing protein [Pseudomonas sp. LAMO17WK12:I10]|nr:TraG-like protein [Pseudomonas sp. LAMO17WK12:I9]SNY53978.1 AAA-like domain-containing protein [Pseudomonas sp. LAMO17WK12:I10]